MPNTKSYTKMQSRNTQFLCYEISDVFATKTPKVSKKPSWII